MQAASGDHATPELRLAACLRKIRAFLRQIDDLLASDFPHQDGKAALEKIRDHFLIWDANIRELSPDDPPRHINVQFKGVSRKFHDYTAILGFILRSTNVRNPFELYFPLRRIVNDVLGADVKILLSSEWDFTPFTFPMNLPELPGFVLVGGPAPESGNVLLAPLAGHEIGHSVWNRLEPKPFQEIEDLRAKFADAVKEQLKKDPPITEIVAESFAKGAKGLEQLEYKCLEYLELKAEEAFCDLFGLYLFGAGFVYAFEYLLAPGAGAQRPDYPTDERRIDFMKRAATAWSIQLDDSALAGWRKAGNPTSSEWPMEFADRALDALMLEVINTTTAIFESKQIKAMQSGKADAIRACFDDEVPYGEPATLQEIVLAGWKYVREKHRGMRPANWGESDDEYEMLQELMLKSIEVSEFNTLLSEHRDRRAEEHAEQQ